MSQQTNQRRGLLIMRYLSCLCLLCLAACAPPATRTPDDVVAPDTLVDVPSPPTDERPALSTDCVSRTGSDMTVIIPAAAGDAHTR